MKILAIHNQSVLDISLQQFGSVNECVALAEVNDLCLTDMLDPGGVVELFDIQASEVRLQAHILLKRIQPTSYIDSTIAVLGGVVYVAPPKVKTNHAYVESNQSPLDLALQYSGGINSLIELCELNGIGISDSLEAGLLIDKSVPVSDEDVLGYYMAKHLRPATSFAPEVVDVSGYAVSTYVEENYWL